MRDFNTPEFHRHTAAIYRGEADARRHLHPDFAATLETWAVNAERRAEAAAQDEQPDLFARASA